jgi:hypothetical protein
MPPPIGIGGAGVSGWGDDEKRADLARVAAGECTSVAERGQLWLLGDLEPDILG